MSLALTQGAGAAAGGTTSSRLLAPPLAAELLDATLHPSGFLAAVGLRDKLSVYNVCASSLSAWRSVTMKAVHAVAYSNGGALLAASAGPLIVVYAAYTMEPVMTLAAHMGVVRQLAWSSDDLHIFSVGEDGGAFLWSVQSGRRIETLSNIVKGCRFSAALVVNTTTQRPRPGGAEQRAAGPGGGFGAGHAATAAATSSSAAGTQHAQGRLGSAAGATALTASSALNQPKHGGADSGGGSPAAGGLATIEALVACGTSPEGHSIIFVCK